MKLMLGNVGLDGRQLPDLMAARRDVPGRSRRQGAVAVTAGRGEIAADFLHLIRGKQGAGDAGMPRLPTPLPP